jgi:uncharacterized SAM-binding protein YcdF (DUF218 family)
MVLLQFRQLPNGRRISINSTIAARRLRNSRRPVAVAAVLATLAMGAWLGREPLLRGTADLWIVSDPVTHADAIVVLGGDFQARPLVAAELYRRGFASKILISQTGKGPGGSPSYSELSRDVLLKLGVPADALDTFGIANKSTRDEAVALREWAERNAASAFIIPDEIFGTRRASWIFRREFSGRTASIEVFSFEPPGYNRLEWWRSEQGLITFQNEFLKYIYYRLKY